MANKPHVLVLDDDPDVLKEVAASLSDHFDVERASTLDEARAILLKGEADDEVSVAVVDMRLAEGKEAGLAFVEELSKRKKRPEAIILTAYPDFDNASKCMQVGAFGYVVKGREDTYALLEEICLKAHARWLQNTTSMPLKPHILVVDKDEQLLRVITETLSEEFYVECVESLVQAQHMLSSYSVVVTEMRLPGDKKAGLTLAQELQKRALRPEMVILTAFPSFRDASECMQAGIFGYIEKGKENTFDLLKQTCIQASEWWYRRHQRIFPALTTGPVALLCGDVTRTGLHLFDDAEEQEAKRIIATFRQAATPAVETHGGYPTKVSDDNFVAVFPTVDDALQAALALQRSLGEATSASSLPPLQFRASVHWGEMPHQPQERQEVERSVMWVGVKALAQAAPGQVVLTQQAQAALREPEGFQLEPLPIAPEQRTDLGEPIPLSTVHEPLPAWIQFALKAAQEITAAGLDVPADLAEQHDFYAHGKRML